MKKRAINYTKHQSMWSLGMVNVNSLHPTNKEVISMAKTLVIYIAMKQAAEDSPSLIHLK